VISSLSVVIGLAALDPVEAAETLLLLNLSYDPARALYPEFNTAFSKEWKTKTGETIAIKQSRGGLGIGKFGYPITAHHPPQPSIFWFAEAKRFQEGDNGMLLKGNARHPIVRMTSASNAGATISGGITTGKSRSLEGMSGLTCSVPPGSNVLQAQVRNTTVEPKHLIDAIYQPRIGYNQLSETVFATTAWFYPFDVRRLPCSDRLRSHSAPKCCSTASL
jgi:hypothetical protein